MKEIRIIIAWCELRQDFRHFRPDRIGAVAVTGERYPSRAADLRARWKALQMGTSHGDRTLVGKEAEQSAEA